MCAASCLQQGAIIYGSSSCSWAAGRFVWILRQVCEVVPHNLPQPYRKDRQMIDRPVKRPVLRKSLGHHLRLDNLCYEFCKWMAKANVHTWHWQSKF